MKLETNGVMTLKNINLLNNDFLSKITTLEQEVNVLQQTLGTATQDIGGLQQQIDVINDELNRQTHFRGYYLLNTDIQNLPNSANGDFAFSAESGTVWMYDQSWYNSGDIVPDQVTPASDAIPLVDSGTGVAGTSNEYSRGDHKHPLQVSDVLPAKDTAVGEVGTATTYARSDHTHQVNLGNSVPKKDTGTGTGGSSNVYSSATHQHPLNIDPTTANVPLVNATAAANGSSDYYCRNDHVHPQQLTYDGKVTATKFIKSGGTNQQILLADGTTTPLVLAQKNVSNQLATNTYIKLCRFNSRTDYVDPSIEFRFQSRFGFGILSICMIYENTELITDILTSDPVSVLPTDYSTKEDILANLQSNEQVVNNGPLQINPTTANNSQGLRISRSVAGCGIYLGTGNKINGTVQNQWQIVSQPDNFEQNPLGLTIGLSSESGAANRGLRISADANTLSFNGSVIAGTGAQSGASNGSVNYSAGNPILWGVNSVGTEGGFYSDGPKIYWRAKPVTLGAVPP
ncbi:MAG: hypothetical protein EZS28_038160 [Streblomastix strix]|uniref:Uncharacterized protein n=1 Tax=Streblomastix strix TaxID=222440 RepID=A0A5J4U7X5_9EUKA|nr:MAG: hypothetical protein EZS28_038160 [Streblomastix strix]